MEKGELPDGWEMKTLGEVCEYDKKKNINFLPYVGLEHIEGNTGRFIGSLEPLTVKSSTFYFTEEHLLYGRLRPYLNKVLLPDFKGHCSTEIFPIKVNIQVSKEFLFYWFMSSKTVEKIDATWTGARMPRANMKEVINFKIPLPPLPQQKQIVTILDKAFTAVDTAKANAEKNLKNAKELFESYLQNVFDPSTRSEQEEEDWEEKPIKEVCELKSGTTISNSLERNEGDVLYTKVGDMNLPDNKVEINTSTRFVNSNEIKVKQIIPEGAIIFPKRGGAIATNKKRKIIKPTIVDLNTMAIIPGNKIDKDYFFHWFQLFDLLSISNGANIPQINNYSFDSVYLPYPSSIKEQKQIVQKLNTLSIETKKLEAIYTQKIADLEEMKKSVLQKAFRGQLNTTPSIETKNKIHIIPNIPTTELHAGIIAIAFQIHIDKKNEKTFHHVKSEKIVHLAENFIGIHLNRNPIKDIAGPNDFQLVKKVEARARKAHFFTVSKESSIYVYKKGSQFQKLIKKTENALGEKVKPLRNLINLMAPMNTQQAEIVATIYAAWNNLIIDNKAIDDKTIVYEARENWSIEKMKIPQEKFFKAIAWMRSNNLTPNGMGKKVNSK